MHNYYEMLARAPGASLNGCVEIRGKCLYHSAGCLGHRNSILL
jgi:hypothetical protein